MNNKFIVPDRSAVNIDGPEVVIWQSGGKLYHNAGGPGVETPLDSQLFTVAKGVTAATTQTQGQGAQTADVIEVDVCATANDTITIRAASAGDSVFIKNNGAETLQIFPAVGDALNAEAVNDPITLASGASIRLYALDATTWIS